MKPVISVITCAHNPRSDYFDLVLAGLKSQTLSPEQWEFLLIDNASQRLLSNEIDLSWHKNARHIREEKLGLTYARLRGINEAQGEILVFVDDDNVLEPDYLEIALQISKDCFFLGAWGGQVIAKFEQPPPEWTKPHLKNLLVSLACREFESDRWSNLLHQHETTPCGAGLCVSKIVAQKYADMVNKDPRRVALGRKGSLLISCEDSDLAFTACDIGLGTGLFTALRLTHLIPPSRMQEDYLLSLAEGLNYSATVLEYLRGKLPSQPSWRISKIYLLYLRLRYGARRCRFYEATQKGIRKAIQEIANWQNYANT